MKPVACGSGLGLAGWLLTALVVFAEEPPPADRAPTADQLAFFERQIRPLLIEHCYKCHSGEAKEIGGELQLDSRAAMRRGGQSGPVVVPGQPDQSRLIQAVRYNDALLQMPPDGKLPQRAIDALVEWVRIGAPDPRDGGPAPARATPAPAVKRSWWSFQPLAAPLVPPVRDETWPLGDVDRFVLARLEAQGLSPAPPADRLTLIRRATFDLTGLPPDPADVEAFVSDPSPDAFAKVVDRLLASPQYGERWGRHWLDVVRYADTSGCNGDFPIVDAYRYRNYVIDSFNRDKPYDEFLREQLAGDLLPAESDEDRFENLIATGYLAISRRFSSLGEEFHLTLDDTVDNLGKAILALTVSCARCHDHKFDPIPQADYYALYGIFQSTTYAFPGTEIYRHTQNLAPLVSAERYQSELGTALAQMVKLDAAIFETYSAMAEMDTGQEKEALRAKWKSMQKQRDEMVKQLPSHDRAFGASEGTPHNSRIHVKGDPKNLGPEVRRGFLQAFGGECLPDAHSGSGRDALADWVTGVASPLAARVIVNRVWLHHFGRGIVRTPDDFGTRGDPPTHPELLDYLARQFLASGWSFKPLHRALMLSRAYQMAVISQAEYALRDPDNRWLWTFNRRRLEAEEIRDAMLVVSGSVDYSIGGPHPFPPEIEWRYTQHKPFVDDFPTNRRTVYVMQQRIRQQPYLAVFDGADTNAATGLRKVSTVAPQALFMLNSEFAHLQAAAFADRVAGEFPEDAQRVVGAYRLAIGRVPSEEEIRDALEYLRGVQPLLADSSSGSATRTAWASYLRVLLSSNEFLFVD
jgi:hypothetical protein